MNKIFKHSFSTYYRFCPNEVTGLQGKGSTLIFRMSNFCNYGYRKKLPQRPVLWRVCKVNKTILNVFCKHISHFVPSDIKEKCAFHVQQSALLDCVHFDSLFTLSSSLNWFSFVLIAACWAALKGRSWLESQRPCTHFSTAPPFICLFTY